MKGYKSFLLGVILTIFVISAFWVGNAYAVACFSDIGSLPVVFQDAICWMKTKGVTSGYPDGTYKPDGLVTRAQMALFMKNQSQVPPTTGDVYINTGPNEWVVNAASVPTASVGYYWGYTHLKASALGTYLYSISPSIPSSLYNTKMYVKGAKLCYDASAAGAYITAIEIKHLTYSSSGFTEWNTIYDDTDHADVGCTTVLFGTPSSFWGNDQVTINLYGTFTGTSNPVRIGVATVILTPSDQAAVLSTDALENRDVVAPATIDGTSGK